MGTDVTELPFWHKALALWAISFAFNSFATTDFIYMIIPT